MTCVPQSGAPRTRAASSVRICRRLCRRDAERGFTLMEVLVVIVIVGIVISVATLSMNVLGTDRQTEEEARRFWAVLHQAREEGQLQALDIGVFVTRTGYEYLRYDQRRMLWLPIYGDKLFARRELPEGLRMRLWLEAREIVLSPGPVERKDEDDDDAQPAPPQIMVLSSGDTTPFELQIEREGAPALWRIVGTPDNDLRVERRENDFTAWQIVAQTRRHGAASEATADAG